MGCLVCERIQMIKDGTSPYFVAELETGYVVLGDHQRFYGYTLFLCKEHLSELFQLPKAFRDKHMEEMAMVAQAVYEAFHPAKMNYELLGNGDSHIHWHLFPRNPGDSNVPGPVWRLEPAELYAEENRPDADMLESMIALLRERLARLKET